MELNKINERLTKLTNETKEKINKINEELEKTKEKLEKINDELKIALSNCDIETHNKLSQEKKLLEEKINFYNDYINNINSMPIVNKDEAKELLNQIDESIKEKVNKDYKDFLKKFNDVYNISDYYCNFYNNAKDLRARVLSYAKLQIDYPSYNEQNIFIDVEKTLLQIKNRKGI